MTGGIVVHKDEIASKAQFLGPDVDLEVFVMWPPLQICLVVC